MAVDTNMFSRTSKQSIAVNSNQQKIDFMPVRLIWMITGLTALMLGFVGVVLPLLPTTPFLLVAVFAFARSSPRLEAWLINHKHFGALIRNWQRDGSIGKRTKISAAVVMALTFLLSFLLGASNMVLIVQAVVLSCAATFVLTRPDGPAE